MVEFPPQIEAAIITEAQAAQVPRLLALALASAESRGNPLAVSPAGARGLFQIMPDTGAAYGLQSDADFFDPQKSANAGLRYLRKLYNRFGKWWLAIAAYNSGPGYVIKNPDYHTWSPRLRSYVQTIWDDMKQTEGGGPPRRPLSPSGIEQIVRTTAIPRRV